MVFDTNQPAQMTGLNGYNVDPIVTIGDTLPSTADGDYLPVGILDGIGAFELNDSTIRVLVNHELKPDQGYSYTLANGASLTGARVSFFDIDRNSRSVIDAGLAYDTMINRAGESVDQAIDLEFKGLNRTCSAHFVPADLFGEGLGFADNIFFTGEEEAGGTEFALDVDTNTLYAVPWLGRAAWENVTPLDTGSATTVSLLIGDDRQAAPLLLYVGEKDTRADAGFLARNGLNQGKLYAWVADNRAISSQEFNGTGNNLTGQFVEIDYYRPELAGSAIDTDADGSLQDELGYDAQGFATQLQQDALVAAIGGFKFSRPEDVATNPADGTQAGLASTGRGQLFPADNWGTTYKIDVEFSDSITADLKILYDGDDAGAGLFAGPDFGLRSPDNLDWSQDGFIYIQEDRSTSPETLFGGTSAEEASIWKLDPTSSQLTRIAQMDRSALPGGALAQTDSKPDDIGNWESSGILDVSTLFDQAPGSLFLFNVQAHSLTDGVVQDRTLVEGGQLAFLQAPSTITLGNFAIGFDSSRVTDHASGFFVADTVSVNEILFDISQPGVITVEDCCLTIDQAELLLSPEFADFLGIADATGTDVGDTRLDAKICRQDAVLAVAGGVTSVFLDLPLLEQAAGLTLTDINSDAKPATDDFQVGFAITDGTDFTLKHQDQGFTPIGGTIEHTGTVTFALNGASLQGSPLLPDTTSVPQPLLASGLVGI
jgi:hypothetical protein